MKNRKTFKTLEHKSGTFTTVPLKLLQESKLKPTPALLLIQILSDSDNFTLSPTLYANRMNVEPKTIYNAIDVLEAHGYIKKTQLGKDASIAGIKRKGSNKKVYFYTVSEFGNLNKPKKEFAVLDEHDELDSGKITAPTHSLLENFRMFLEGNAFFQDAFSIIEFDDLKDFRTNLNQYNLLIKRIEKAIPEVQKEYMVEVKRSLRDFNNDKYPESLRKAMNEKIKDVVFTEGRKFNEAQFQGANNEAQSHWSTLRNRHGRKNYKVDYETAQADKREQDYEDMY